MSRFALARTVIVAGSVLTSAVLLTHAGPLDPPAGPIAPTYKTLAETDPGTPITALPITINQPGAYYLARSLTGTSGSHGITVLSNNVTLDLRGFALTGAPGALSGVAIGQVTGVEVKNGTISAWPVDGIQAFDGVACRYDGLRLLNNGRAGLRSGYAAAVQRCTALGNGAQAAGDTNPNTRAAGIQVSYSSSVRDCTCDQNSGIGIAASDGSTVIACVSNRTAYSGAATNGYGIATGIGCTVEHCSLRGNALAGAIIDTATTIESCNVSLSLVGVYAGTSCRVIGNVVVDASTGVSIQPPNLHVTVDGNTLIGPNSIGSVGVYFTSGNDANVIVRNDVRLYQNLFGVAPSLSVGPAGAFPSNQTSPWANFPQ